MIEAFEEKYTRLEHELYNTSYGQVVLGRLEEENRLFLNYINLAFQLVNHTDIHKTLGMVTQILSAKFINHTLCSYKLLCDGMIDEFFILSRQSLEVVWLLHYLLWNPKKMETWLTSETYHIGVSELREFIDAGDTTQKLYKIINNFAHPKGASKWTVMNRAGTEINILGRYMTDFIKYGLKALTIFTDYLIYMCIFKTLNTQKAVDCRQIIDSGIEEPFEEDLPDLLKLYDELNRKFAGMCDPEDLMPEFQNRGE